jgi:acyl-CoA synthetase (NDP forming)
MHESARVSELLQRALDQNQCSLSEYDSKCVLGAYGVRVIGEALAHDAAAAVNLAGTLGYPVAIKGCAPGLAHKSDLGLVRLNLANAMDVETATREALAAGMPAVLVQRMAAGRREIIVGGARDAAFGAYVMLGVGGVAVEAVADVSFCLSPPDDRDVAEMVLELRGSRLFGAFRGEPPVSMQALAETLRAVGRIMDEHPCVSHIDINPLIVENGIPVAVDALISLSSPAAPPSAEPVPHAFSDDQFKALFEPASVAIIGASDTPAKWGFRILFNTLEGGYRGRLYGINPKHTELLGVPCFPNMAALPETPDLALVVIPPPAVPAAVLACAEKGVKAVVVITAGFGELDNGGARALQAEIAGIARETGMLLAGPNCAGVASPAPHSLFCGMLAGHPRSGGLSLVSQSGNVGGSSLTWAQLHQVGMARFVSSGNEAATRTEDYLDFFARDPRTASILMYVEGVKRDGRFVGALRGAAARKPVVLIKGGRSAAGLKAAQSHTGALAGETRVFRAVCRQAGASVVDDSHEAMETAAAFVTQPLPKGRRIGIVSQGGGWGVLAADACVDAGLEVPPLPDETVRELDAFMPGWWSRGNPVDLVAGNDLLLLSKAVECVIKCPAVDGVLVLGIGYISDALSRFEKSERAKRIGLNELAAMGSGIEVEGVRHIAGLVRQYGKPLLIASDTALTAHTGRPNAAILEMEHLGFCVLSSPSRVARVMAHLARRHEYLQGIPRK